MTKPSHDTFRITLLGSGAPPPRLDRFGPSTLVEVGKENSSSTRVAALCSDYTSLGFRLAILRECFLPTIIPTMWLGSRICGLPDGSAGPGANVMFRSRFGDRKGLDK